MEQPAHVQASTSQTDMHDSAHQVSTDTDTADLFVSGQEPQIFPNGTLDFRLRPDGHGRAKFRVKLADSGGETSAYRDFDIWVTPVRLCM
jgi:hypothetical protein